MIDLSRAVWRKSRRSGSGNNCVEIARASGVIAVRDSKNPDGPPLMFDRATMEAFVAAVKDNQHNL